MKEFDALLQTVAKFYGVVILDSICEPDNVYITFKCKAGSALSTIQSTVLEIRDSHACNFLTFPEYEHQNDPVHQIMFDGEPKAVELAISTLDKMFNNILDTGSTVKARQRELGLPDMSLTTIRQMVAELKKRENLCFAVVWIEDNERDNIAIEGSGNPTQLVGLLARGMHMTIEWADKNIKFHRPPAE